MTLWTKEALIDALGSQLVKHHASEKISIDEVIIDSRKADAKKLFLALKGNNHDAHTFLKQVFENRCTTAIIHNESDFNTYSQDSLNLFLVKDTAKALNLLAAFSRKRSQAKIIAITGSVGKTSTKEMLHCAFATQGKTYATPGNLNNHIGLPLCLSNFPADCDYGIFEMGMNHLGEIAPLSKLTKPHLAIITNVGPVHIENFKNEEEIAEAKSEIFSGLNSDGIVLLNHDNKHFNTLKDRAKKHAIAHANILSFGEDISSDYQLLESVIEGPKQSIVKVKTKDQTTLSYALSSSHKAIIVNSTIVLACLDLLGKNLKTGLASLEKPQNSNGRGALIEAQINGKHITIIDDSYNASVLSVKSGLEYAVSLKKTLHKNRIVVALGDMLELGDKTDALHEEVLHTLQTLNIDLAFLIGKQMTISAHKSQKNIYKTYLDAHNAAREIKTILCDGDILYIKGSRGMKMETIIKSLTTHHAH